MCHLIGESLYVIGLHLRVVIGDYVMSGRDCALVDMLRHEKKVKVFFACDCVVHNRARRRINLIPILLYKKLQLFQVNEKMKNLNSCFT